MELRNILTFLRVAELESFSKAADSLGYAQSTVTIQIQQLEKELGQPLFDRINRCVSLTAFGKHILPLARKMRIIEKEFFSIDVSPDKLFGTLRIGIVESLLFSDFFALVTMYQKQFPHILVDLRIASSVEIIESLRKNEIDIGFYLTTDALSSQVTYHLTKKSSVVFLANNNHALSSQTIVSCQEISQEGFILTEDNGIYTQILKKLFNEHSLTLKENIRVNSTRGVIDMLKQSGNIAFLPEYTARRELLQGNLKILHDDFNDTSITIIGATDKNRWISPQMQGLINLALQEEWP